MKKSIFSAILLSLLSLIVNAQIYYHDLNPDTIISVTGQQFDLDLNNDGTVDFYIAYNNFGGYIQTEFYTNIGQLGKVLTNGNGAPLALSINDNINSSQSYWICTATSSSSSALSMNYNGAAFVGLADKYVGLRIKLSNQWYYGWIRLSIPSDTSKIIIKDYAYNQVPNTSINAGQTTATGINEADYENRVSVYPNPFSTSAKIEISSEVLNSNSQLAITVYNILGKEVEQIANIKNERVKLERGNLPKGIYFYQLTNEAKIIGSGKLMIE